MIPKIIHLCWFSNDPFPVEIKVCIDTWKRLLPDYTIKRWTYDDALAMNSPFVNEALSMKKWAFAADVVRFYALYREGGVYMDSDIFLKRRFDEFIPEKGFATFIELPHADNTRLSLQAAFMIGEKGNSFCKDMLDYYDSVHFNDAKDIIKSEVSPIKMSYIAEKYGFVHRDIEQKLGDLTVYPARYLSPRNKFEHDPNSIGVHRIYGSWRNRKFGRRFEIAIKHYYHVIKYALLKK